MKSVFALVFTLTLCVVFAVWLAIGFVAYQGYKMASDPKATARVLGETVKEFQDGMEK